MKKRFLSLILTAAILLSLILCTAAVGAAAELVGDTDGDGTVSVLDATAIQRYLVELEQLDAQAIARARVNGKDELSILDATMIQRYLADLVDRFPAGETLSDETATEKPTGAVTEKPTEAPTEPATEAPTTPEEVTKVKDVITIYFSNNKKWTTVNAYIYNNATGVPMKAWPGSPMTFVKINNEGEQVYSATVDVTKYDRIIFNNGTDQTTDTPVTKASTGYFLNSKKSYNGKYLAGVYPYGENGEGNVKTISMDYPDGYKKKIYIWTPEGYNANDKTKKYSVLYMCDGQNLFGQETTLSGYEWECDESVLSLMKNGGDGVIVVGVEAGSPSSRRDHELTPNLGSTAPGVYSYGTYSNGGGKVFSDFVVDTVIPYVEKNYNVNSIRGIAGSSSGGIEAFYIGIEHMDKFRYIGALSPAFILYEQATWNNYLKTKDFSGSVPRIYFFCGNSAQDQLEQMLYPNATAMQGWLKDLGYPSEKMITVTDQDATHSEGFWAVYFPEMLSWGMDL